MELVFLSIINFIINAFAIYDVIKNQKKYKTKFFWLTIIGLLPVLGVILYFTLGKPKVAKTLQE